MRVESLTIRNFRGIRVLDLQFPRDMVVFVGTNGVGKTGVLDALATMLARLPEKLTDASPLRWLDLVDIHNEEAELILTIAVSSEGRRIAWSMTISRLLSRVHAEHDEAQLSAYSAELLDLFRVEPTTAMPLAVYFPTTRTELDIPDRIRTPHIFDQFGALELALSDNETTFRLFFEWFRDREDYENERRVAEPAWRDPQLQAVRSATSALLPGYADLRIQRQPLRMTIKKGTRELTVSQLSDGERCTLALAGDIARRLSIAHPASADPLGEQAIVLIDEVELHLHPGWQRNVIVGLRRAFPNAQFILSTHSPQVLSEVHPDDVLLLELDQRGEVTASRVESSFGQTSDRILEDVMGVPAHPPEIEEKLGHCFSLIDSGNLIEAKAELVALAGRIGASTPELVRADLLLRRKEILQRAPH